MEKLFNGGALLCGVALTAEADNVQSGDTIGTHGRTEVGDIFAKAAVALNHTGVTDADELMKHGSTTDEGVAADMDVASQHAAIGQDIFTPQLHVVGEVDTNHDEVSVAQGSGAAGLAATMDRDVLTNDILGAYDDAAVCLGIKT